MKEQNLCWGERDSCEISKQESHNCYDKYLVNCINFHCVVWMFKIKMVFGWKNTEMKNAKDVGELICVSLEMIKHWIRGYDEVKCWKIKGFSFSFWLHRLSLKKWLFLKLPSSEVQT